MKLIFYIFFHFHLQFFEKTSKKSSKLWNIQHKLFSYFQIKFFKATENFPEIRFNILNHSNIKCIPHAIELSMRKDRICAPFIASNDVCDASKHIRHECIHV